MGKSATQVKDCTPAPTPTAILSSRGLGHWLAVDEFKRRHIKVLGRGELKMWCEALTSELTSKCGRFSRSPKPIKMEKHLSSGPVMLVAACFAGFSWI